MSKRKLNCSKVVPVCTSFTILILGQRSFFGIILLLFGLVALCNYVICTVMSHILQQEKKTGAVDKTNCFSTRASVTNEAQQLYFFFFFCSHHRHFHPDPNAQWIRLAFLSHTHWSYFISLRQSSMNALKWNLKWVFCSSRGYCFLCFIWAVLGLIMAYSFCFLDTFLNVQ